MLLHQACESVIAQLAGAEGFHKDRNRLGHTDGITQLHFYSFGQASGYEALGHIASGVGS